ncbi:MAG: metalloregulator ArsR/SmtB family transcription factor [Planctomycetota bacterium]
MRVTEYPDTHALLRAFADPTRLRLLALLRLAKREGGGEVCVCDLVDVLELPQPTVSRHLAALRGAGLVLVRKDGAWSHYRLAPADGAVHRRLLGLLDVAHEGAADVRSDASRLRRAKCC